MSIEHASVRPVPKPWGVRDLQPWSSVDGTGDAVGELWFERAAVPAALMPIEGPPVSPGGPSHGLLEICRHGLSVMTSSVF